MDSPIDKLLSLGDPYLLDRHEKNKVLLPALKDLDVLHARNCLEYGKILAANVGAVNYLPVRLFKLLELKSVSDDKVFKTLTSSGTTSQVVSKIFLDTDTARDQTRVLVHIMQSFLGKKRLPMLIIDHPSVVKSRESFSARGAGILGLSNFGRQHTYALNDDMTINYDAIEAFLAEHKGENIFLFGFTFMVWQYFLQKIKSDGKKLALDNGILVHSGGWKKLQDVAVDNLTFKNELKTHCGISRVHNFYGMVEQVGSIFVECESGHLHCPNFADIHFLNVRTGKPVSDSSLGVIAVESLLPKSYPGHRLLTEDMGYLIGEDDCECGRKGKYFAVTGRLPKAELRGCSDTHEKK